MENIRLKRGLNNGYNRYNNYKFYMRKTKDLQYYEAVGRRKTAVARVRLYIIDKDKTVNINGLKIHSGQIFINQKPIESVFSSLQEKKLYLKPLKLTKNEERFAISAKILSGGRVGQLAAFIHGLSRALELVDKENYRLILKKNNLLTRDARMKERRKIGTGGKARRKKQSPKR